MNDTELRVSYLVQNPNGLFTTIQPCAIPLHQLKPTIEVRIMGLSFCLTSSILIFSYLFFLKISNYSIL